MATYASYKRISSDNLTSNSITDDGFASTAAKKFSALWVRGCLGMCSPGCCCLWTVPTGVKRATFDLWGAGGNGSGACSCNRCHHFKGAQGGYYNTKSIDVQEGWTYTLCAGGVYPCLSQECVGCNGCTTYATGCNLNNFCAIGGTTACANADWNIPCYSEFPCCVAPGVWGGDFAMGNHAGAFHGNWLCHCHFVGYCATGAPFMSGQGVGGCTGLCWINCGGASVPYANGGQSATTTYCGACCGQGGTGGSGVIKITFI